MKKNLFYLFALICSMSLFTACSDDEDTAWKEIPQTEIPAGTEGVTLNVNGVASSTGSVQMTVKNESEAVLNLKGVIPGYAEVPVNVELQKQSDGSFNFAGEANLTTPPSMTKMAATAPAIFIVSVNGNITKEGKAAVTATTNLSEQAQGGLAGTWNLLNKLPMTETGGIATAPLWITWSAIDAEKANMESAAYMLNVLAGTSIIYNLLGNVTFNADGNITANYNSTKELDMETVMGYMEGMESDENNTVATLLKMNKSWADSPKNLAYWYTKDNLLYVVPNIAAILKQVAADNGGAGADSGLDLEAILAMLAEYNINVTALLPKIQEWMTTGIPLKYTASADGLKVYVDKEMAAPFVEALLPALDVLQPKIDAILADPDQAETAFLIQMAFGMLGIEGLSDIQTVWNENTKEFEIALNLTK